MDNMNKQWKKEINDAVTALIMPDGMADELLESSLQTRHSKKILFRHSKLAAAVLLTVFCATLCTTSYAAYDLYQTKNVRVFFNYDITPEEIDAAGRELRSIPGISNIRFVSGEDAWEEFRSAYLTEELSDMFEENPLAGASNYEIAIKLDADTQAIREQIECINGIRKVSNLYELKDTYEP